MCMYLHARATLIISVSFQLYYMCCWRGYKKWLQIGGKQLKFVSPEPTTTRYGLEMKGNPIRGAVRSCQSSPVRSRASWSSRLRKSRGRRSKTSMVLWVCTAHEHCAGCLGLELSFQRYFCGESLWENAFPSERRQRPCVSQDAVFHFLGMWKWQAPALPITLWELSLGEASSWHFSACCDCQRPVTWDQLVWCE